MSTDLTGLPGGPPAEGPKPEGLIMLRSGQPLATLQNLDQLKTRLAATPAGVDVTIYSDPPGGAKLVESYVVGAAIDYLCEFTGRSARPPLQRV